MITPVVKIEPLKIEVQSIKFALTFNFIDRGQVFKTSDDKFYIKIVEYAQFNALNLQSFDYSYFGQDSVVYPLNAKLTIENK